MDLQPVADSILMNSILSSEAGPAALRNGSLIVNKPGDVVMATDSVTSSASDQLPLWESVTFIVMTSVCICTTVVGNVLVILSVFTYRPLNSVQNYFIVSLAVADLTVSLLVMPLNVANYVIGHWVFGEVLCNLWLTLDILCCTASILNLCAIAVDRYYAIHDPITYAQKRTSRRVVISIALAWLLSAVISVPPLIGWNNSNGRSLYDPIAERCQLTDTPSFVLYSAIGSFYGPLLLMTVAYVKIFVATRQRLLTRANKACISARLASVRQQTLAGADSSPTTLPPGEQSSGDSDPEQDQSPAKSTHALEATARLIVSVQAIGRTQLFQHHHHHLHRQSSPQTPTQKSPAKKWPQSNGNRTGGGRRGSRSRGGGFGGGGGGGGGRRLNEERQKISLSKERRAARTMAVIMGSFVVCWLPFFCMYVTFAYAKQLERDTSFRVVNFIVWLGYINSTLNPIIYTIFNKDFRQSFKRLLRGHCTSRR